MSYLFLFLSFIISFFIAWCVIPGILIVCKRKRLFDPVNTRKLHKEVRIPRLGGVAFFPSILFTVCFIISICLLKEAESFVIGVNFILPEFLLLICGLILLYFTGVADDLIGVRYRMKFFIQIFSACLLTGSGLWINNFYGLFGITEIPIWFGAPLSVFVIVFITNAINLIDGIDGLASGLSSLALIIFGVLFLEKDLWMYSLLAFSTFGGLAAFFYYNVIENSKRKIFMGDTGSLTLGYILSFLAIKYSQYAPEEISSYKEGTLLIAFGVLLVPIFDVARVILLRRRTGKPLFEPDKNHIHHKFLAMGYSPRQVLIIIMLISCGFSAANILLVKYVDNTILFVGDIVIWIGLNLWWDRIRDKRLKTMKQIK